MKQLKKAVAVVLALALSLALAGVAFADGDETSTYSITIKNSAKGHTYEAYQIFAGDVSGKVLSNITWGSGIDASETTSLGDAKTKAHELDGADTAQAEQFAKGLEASLGNPTGSTSTLTTSEATNEKCYVISDLEPGYYLIKDLSSSQNGKDDAYTSYILQVVGDVSVSPKSAMPTFDKQVLDEVADADASAADGWGETADHAINESFQFKLIATLPEDVDFASYSSYRVIFNDKMSDGVTFEFIESVKVNSIAIDSSAYTCTATAGQEGGDWTLTIANVMSHDTNLADGATIEVVYNAHLNDNATSSAVGSAKGANKNEAYLQYSNNPNASGSEELGETATDTVWVFAYALNNTKVDGSNNQPLVGAGFKLYADESLSSEVALVFDSERNVYRPVAEGEEGVEMTSAAETGVFNIVGLDAGSYWLKETTTPAGYNTCAPIEIVISAEHVENPDGAATSVVGMTVDGVSATENIVVNESGVALPSTGGMGTVIFYVAGSVLLIGACALLIARRRTDSE